MTINNSGGVKKYDGQPMPNKKSKQSIFEESLEDFFENFEFDKPVSYDPPIKDYPPKQPLQYQFRDTMPITNGNELKEIEKK